MEYSLADICFAHALSPDVVIQLLIHDLLPTGIFERDFDSLGCNREGC